MKFIINFFLISLEVVLGLNSLSNACWASALPLEPGLQPFFCFSYFSDCILYFYQQPVSDCDTPTSASHLAGMTGMNNHALFVETGYC
jgi:hypothetical protein